MPTKIFTFAKLLRKHGFVLRSQKTDIVVFGYAENVELFSKFVSGKTIQLFDPSYQSKIYLVPFMFAIATKMRGSTHSTTHHYFVYFLKRARPKVVLSHFDNSADLWSAGLELRNSAIGFAIFQNGFRKGFQIPQTAMLGENDVVMCLSDAEIDTYKAAAGKATVLALGSLRSKLATEQMMHSVKSHKSNQACFISQWRPSQLVHGRQFQTWSDELGNLVETADMYRSELETLPVIAAALRNLGMKLQVLGSIDHLAKQERDFYVEILGPEGGDWEFRARHFRETNYARLHDYAVAFCIDSTLGYEALAEGHRVMFLQSTDLKGLRAAFGYPNHQALALSPLHLRSGSENEWKRRIDDVLAMSSEDYEELAREVVGSRVRQTRAQDIRNVISELFE